MNLIEEWLLRYRTCSAYDDSGIATVIKNGGRWVSSFRTKFVRHDSFSFECTQKCFSEDSWQDFMTCSITYDWNTCSLLEQRTSPRGQSESIVELPLEVCLMRIAANSHGVVHLVPRLLLDKPFYGDWKVTGQIDSVKNVIVEGFSEHIGKTVLTFSSETFLLQEGDCDWTFSDNILSTALELKRSLGDQSPVISEWPSHIQWHHRVLIP